MAHKRERVQAANIHDLDLMQVPGRQAQVVLALINEDQDPLQPQTLQLRDKVAGLWPGQLDIVDNDQAILPNQF